MGVSSILGCIPTDVAFTRIMPSSGWKLSKSAKGKASPPTASASFLARSLKKKERKLMVGTKKNGGFNVLLTINNEQ